MSPEAPPSTGRSRWLEATDRSQRPRPGWSAASTQGRVTVNARLKLLGIAMIGFGIFGAGVASYTLVRTLEGVNSLQAFSAAQGVKLSYNEQGQLVDRGTPEAAQKIIDLVKNDWGYALVMSDLNPNDPLVNTASEYMYQMGAISYHTLYGTTTVTLTEDKEYKGQTFAAGTYEFKNTGKYWADFDRQHPIEGAARERIWTGTAHALIGQLGVGAVTASTLQIGLGLVGVIGGLAGTLLALGVGLFWVARSSTESTRERRALGTANPAPAGS
jgi:hypothetical protein